MPNIVTEGITGDITLVSTKDIVIKSAKTVLSDSEIKALPTAAIVAVPAPGVGKMILFHRARVITKFTGGAYEGVNQADPGPFVGAARNGGFLSLSENPDGLWLFADDSENGIADLLPKNQLTNYVSYYENKELLFGVNFGTAWTGGNASNTLEVTVFYSIVDL